MGKSAAYITRQKRRCNMRKTATYLCGCRGKVKHPTEQAALFAVRKMLKEKATSVEAYRCRYCELWHTGKSNILASSPYKP